MRSREAKTALWLEAVAFIVLLIACTNVANLLSARFLQRRHELAVRRALGSGSGRLFLDSFSEVLLLAFAGGCAGVLISVVLGRPLLSRLLSNLAWSGSPIGVRLLTFTALASLAAGLLAGLVPAVQASRVRLGAILKNRDQGRVGHGLKFGPLLSATQAALSLVLLIAAGLFVRSLHNVHSVELGLDVDKLIVAEVDPDAVQLSSADRTALLRRVIGYLRRTPGISSVSVSSNVPMWSSSTIELKIPGRSFVPGDLSAHMNSVSEDFFATIGLTLLDGHIFCDGEQRRHQTGGDQ